jgi:hypothetical protein
MASFTPHGNSPWQVLLYHLHAYQHGQNAVQKEREVIWDVTPHGTFVNGLTGDTCLAQARKILLDSGQVYRWGDSLCFEVKESQHQQLLVLASRQKPEPGAAGMLANLFCVGVQTEDKTSQALPPAKLVNALLADQDLWRQAPHITHYARRSVFDTDFNLCGPGWHPNPGFLVHGPDITPIMPPSELLAGAKPLDRLPPFTRTLLREFCWRGESDLTNALALLLTGLLINHFVEQPHPAALLDANQPGVGKTLFAQATGRVLDGCEPPRIPLVRDEELEKKLCAQLRDGRSSIFFFDNVRSHIESALLEANVLSPVLCFRILGQSATVSRPNSYLWLVTSNLTSGTSDFVRRGLPIRFHHEGDLKKRVFTGNPLEYATEHRLEILGELAGMVLHWRQQGMPAGKQKHRCSRWAQVIGGILAANGFEHFLANLEEAEAAMDETLQGLATLAERVVTRGMEDLIAAAGDDAKGRGKPPRDWTPHFLEAEVCRDKLNERSPKGRDTWVGQFLSGKVDCSVAINTQQGSGTATLRMREGRSRQKVYFFEVELTPEQEAPPQTAVGGFGLAIDIVPPAKTMSPVDQPASTLATPLDQGETGDPLPVSHLGNASAASKEDGSDDDQLPGSVGSPGNDLNWT